MLLNGGSNILFICVYYFHHGTDGVTVKDNKFYDWKYQQLLYQRERYICFIEKIILITKLFKHKPCNIYTPCAMLYLYSPIKCIMVHRDIMAVIQSFLITINLYKLKHVVLLTKILSFGKSVV